jgi:hypothetical protein
MSLGPEPEDTLQRRLALLADPKAQGADFDRASWFWLLLLGLIGPIVLIILGWGA